MGFCKIRQLKGLWIAGSKKLGSLVLMSKNSVSILDILNICLLVPAPDLFAMARSLCE